MAREHDDIDTKPEINKDHVRFNGKLEQGHETFMLTRTQEIQSYLKDQTMAFEFCKTRQDPYDKFVVACLIWAKMVFGNDVKISSDGEISDW